MASVLSELAFWQKRDIYSLFRDASKAQEAKKSLLNDLPEGKLTMVQCDQASLKSIEQCEKILLDSANTIHVLRNA